MSEEVWTEIPGFPGYEVSNCGNVRTYRSQNGRGAFNDAPRPVKQDKAKGKKYFRVSLSVDGKRFHKRVHVLVLTAFRSERPSPKHDGCHDDGNAENNHLSNLYWGTKQENADDHIRHGTQCRGSLSGKAKLTEEQAAEIVAHLPYWKKGDGRRFAEKFGVGDTAISSIKHGLTWRHV